MIKSPAFSHPLQKLSDQRWFLLMLAAPFLLFPSPGTVLALLIVPGLGIIFWLAEKHPFPRTPLNPAILMLAVMLLVSTGVTYDMAISLPKIAGLILGIELFFCYASYGATPRGWVGCLLLFLMAGVGVALLGLMGTQWSIKFNVLGPFTYRFEPLITGLPGVEKGFSPNEVAGALLWVIPTILMVSLIAWVKWRRMPTRYRWLAPINLLAWEAVIFVSLVFLLCQSRGAYLALALSFVLLVLWLLRHRWRWYFGLLIAMGIFVVAFAWRFEVDSSLRQAVGMPSVGRSSIVVDALDGRDKIWARALLGVEKYPLTGMGINVFRYQVNALDPTNPIYINRDIAHAHNEFLQAALDLGIPGMIAFAAIYLIAFQMLIRVWNQAKPAPPGAESFGDEPYVTQMMVLGLGTSLFAHLLYGLTDAVALGAKPGILFWMLLGLIVGLYHQKIERRANLVPQLDAN